MDSHTLALLIPAIAVVALLYSCVGHAGASGYIAVMTLLGLSGDYIKPTSLMLNIIVASLASYQFWRAGYFSWRLFWPFAVTAGPMAYCGGRMDVPAAVFHTLAGAMLLFSAWRLLAPPPPEPATPPHCPSILTATSAGALIGLLSGLTGTGGGIFLTPLLLLRRWARAKEAAAVSALFIFVNSCTGLTGHLLAGKTIPQLAWPLVLAAIIGGAVGAGMGSRHLPVRTITSLLAIVLIFAGGKFLFMLFPAT